MIIDAQIHIWVETPGYPIPEATRRRSARHLDMESAKAMMDAHGVDRAIIVPPGGWSAGPTKNGYSMEAAAKYPDRFAVMGQLEFDQPGFADAIPTWRRPGMLGIRRYFGGNPKPLTDGSHDALWAKLVEYDVPCMSTAPHNMHLYVPVLERFPTLRLIIDHAGREGDHTPEDRMWDDLDDTLKLAKFPNAAIKVTSLPSYTSEAYPFPSLHDPIRRIYDAFGPRRMLWGSDATRLKCSYEDNMRLFTEALGFLNADDKDWIMGKAAAKHCRWP